MDRGARRAGQHNRGRSRWLVDARTDPLQFDMLRHTPTGYEPTPANAGWLRSEILGKEFRLVCQAGPLGHSQIVVEVDEERGR
jgi:hypothetical protein